MITMPRLILHDLLILRNGFRNEFATIKDKVLLAAGILAASLWMREIAGDTVLAERSRWPALLVIASGMGGGVQWAVHRRLANIIENSPLCSDALDHACRRAYAAFWHAICLGALTIVAAVMGASLSGISGLILSGLAVAYLAGVGGAIGASRVLKGMMSFDVARPHRLPARPREIVTVAKAGPFALIASKQIVLRKRPISTAAIVMTFATLVAIIPRAPGLEPDVATAAILALSALLLFVVARVDHEIVRFLAFAGYSSFRSAAVHLAMPMLSAVILIAASSLRSPSDGASLTGQLALLAALLAIIITLRVWHYRSRSRRAADLALQVDLAVTLLLALSTPPLALLWLGVRSVLLFRRASNATWAVKA